MEEVVTGPSSNPFSAALDGAQKMVGMKDGALTGGWERLGAVAVVAIPTVIVNDQFRIKRALKATLNETQQKAVKEATFGGSLTLF